MPHHTPLISTIVVGIVLAFAFGAILQRLRVSPLVGYLLAGVVIGPFTPGFIADQALASQLAEIGVILLMFGVGLQFSLEHLLAVRTIAITAAIAQIAIVTPCGMALGWALGWSASSGMIFGFGLSIASTVVMLRALQERRLVETDRGRIAVGWSIVEDIATVFLLVFLPPYARLALGGAPDPAELMSILGWTVGKIVVFVGVMLFIGIHIIPSMLHYVAHTGSRELFRLAVLAIALGFAFVAAELFGISFALGAFLAGMVLSESRLSQQAAQESLPLRDAFAVLFFVSVGMLFDPAIIVAAPLSLFITVVLILGVKAVSAYGIVRLFGYSRSTTLVIAVSRAQIGEFSFVLASYGVAIAVLPAEARDLTLAGAIISILVNPLLFAGVDRWLHKPKPEAAAPAAPEPPTREPIPVTQLRDHVVLVGHGRVGRFISEALVAEHVPLLVIETNAEALAPLRAQGIETIEGNGADPEIVQAANLAAARCLLVAIPDAFEGGQVVEQARAINSALTIVARAHSEAEGLHLMRHGVSIVVMAEHEIARTMLEDVPKAAGAAPE